MTLAGVLQVLPKPVVDLLRFGRRCVRLIGIYISSLAWATRDCLRYLRHQGERPSSYTRSQQLAHINKTYHALEKGLSLRDTTPGFGVKPSLRLLSLVEDFVAKHGPDPAVFVAMDALDHYLSFQISVGHAFPLITARLAAVRQQLQVADTAVRDAAALGGVRAVSRSEIIEAANVDFGRFLESRHSIRDFDTKPVSAELLAQACELAQLAPSACNRQAGRAHCFTEPAMVRQVLSLQPGNRGFGSHATAAIVITGSLDAYAGAGERHQALVDGSLFGMTLVYALHSLGLGTCMLAWSVPPKTDDELRRVAGVPDNEDIIVLLAVGHLPKSLRVPASVRSDRRSYAKITPPGAHAAATVAGIGTAL